MKERILVQYKPTVHNMKWVTAVCSGNNNKGIDDQERFKKAVAMLEHAAHNWRNPRLFHLVMTGADRSAYQQLLTRLCRKVRSTGAQCDYKYAIELDNDKGLHCHVMFVLSSPRRPQHFFTIADESGVTDASLLRRVVREVQADHPDLKASVQRPQSQPKPLYYIEFNQTNNELLNEACEWCSYIFKSRSKPKGQCYGSSRPARRACKGKGNAINTIANYRD